METEIVGVFADDAGEAVAHLRLALAFVIDLRADGLGLAAIAVGYAVTPADGIDDVGTALRYRSAHTLVVGDVAGAVRELTVFAVLAGNAGDAAADAGDHSPVEGALQSGS